MTVRTRHFTGLTVLLIASAAVHAQTPADLGDDGYRAGVSSAEIETIGGDAPPPLAARDLETLVGPVALYPDALLAIILPASAYPLQIVQAARFLDEVELDSTLEPSSDWDESIVALLNYPDVLRQLNDDIDWTLELGEAVIYQQADVMAAVQRFRDRAMMAGNLKSDERQNVIRDESVIEIQPVDDDVIYVPVYEPATVVQYSAYPVYSYRPVPYPVYYYPYPDGHAFRSGYFWGLTSAYALGWHSRRVHVIHHTYAGHPYFGHYYSPRWWYRRPTLAYHNRAYFRTDGHFARERYRSGDYWVPRQTRYSILSHDRTYRRHDQGYRVRRHENTMVRPAPDRSRSQSLRRESARSSSVRAAPRPEARQQVREPASSAHVPRQEYRRPAEVPRATDRRSRSEQLSPQKAGRRVERAPTYRQGDSSRRVPVQPASRSAPSRPASRAPSASRPAPSPPASRAPSVSRPAQSRPAQSRPARRATNGNAHTSRKGSGRSRQRNDQVRQPR
jgi:hypothetical protein